MKKRILIYSTAYFPFVGGAEVAVKEITDRLADYQFVMVTALLDNNLPRQERIGNIVIHRIGFGIPLLDKIYLAKFGYLKGLKLHQEKKFDIVWSIMASYSGFAALSFKLKTRVKYLLTLQEGDFTQRTFNKIRLVKEKFYRIFSEADGLQSISNYLHNWGFKMGFKGQVAKVVPNGVNVNLFTRNYPQEEITELRQSFGFPEDSIIIVTSSRLAVKNGIEDVIKALKKLPEQYCFYICGRGELEGELKSLTKELVLDKRVKFAGYKSHLELAKILKASDIFIRPSITEGLGNSFLEAMASGLPTIGTLVGGIPDFLKDGVTGLVCEPQNPQSIAKAIERAGMLNQVEKEKLHQNALQIINERYNWEYIAERMDCLFRRLIE